ncbi:MAG: hypothetical protein AAF206_03605 [Bacteroidota bacterium]
MKLIFIPLAVLLSLGLLKGNPQAPEPSPNQISVYVFLHDACLISQYYSVALRDLHAEYASENLHFIGLFPSFASKAENIEAFRQKYQIPFELKQDYYHLKTTALGATVTPEVVVYDEAQQQILYKGRIDDAYARVGQRKRYPSTSELRDVLDAIQSHQPIKTQNTQAIGCFIEKNKLTYTQK